MAIARQIGRIDIEFSGDFKELPEFNRDALINYIHDFVKKYGDESEIFEISIYIKKFESNYFGKPLIFCNFAANTTYGLLSTNVVDWGLRKSVRDCLKALILDVNKLAERELYGEYVEVSV